MDLSSVLASADTVNVQAGGRSLFEKAGDALTAGVAGAVVSGLGSIYNTAVYGVNKLTGADYDELDTAKVLGDIDTNWQRYYQENKDVIDTVGFIGGAFIPGGAAVKALNLARTGKSVGPVGRVLGFTLNKQNQYLQEGLQEIASQGTNVFSALNRNKLMSMAYGAADNVLQTAVFETAAAAAMARGPVLADESWTDISWDIARTSLAGGLLGGGIEAIWTNRIFRDAGKAVDKASRKYDTFGALQELNLTFGDKAFGIMDELFAIPKEVLADDRALKFSYRLNGRDTPVVLNIGDHLDNKLKTTVAKAEEKFRINLTNAMASDTSVGAPFSQAMVEIAHRGLKEGKDLAAVREELGNYLFNLERVQPLSIVDDVSKLSNERLYLVPGASLRSAKEGNTQLFTDVKLGGDAVGYQVIGNPATARSGILGAKTTGATLKEAWDNGFDIVFAGREGKVHINPKSSVFKKVDEKDDLFTRTTINTRTKQLSDEPIVTAADMATTKRPISVNATGVSSGRYTFQFSTGTFEPTLDSLENTARHLWATQVTDLRNQVIDGWDFALLDRARAMSKSEAGDFLAGLQVRVGDNLVEFPTHGADSFVHNLKLDAAEQLLNMGQGQVDKRLVAYALNTEADWIDQAVATQFARNKQPSPLGFRDQSSYLVRENLVLTYKKVPISDPAVADFPTGTLAWQHRVKLAKEQAQSASAAVLGKSFERFVDLAPDRIVPTLDATGSGATGFGASNADYSDIGRLWAQDVGRATHLTMQEFRNAALEQVQSHAAKLITTGNKELGAVVNKARLSDHSLTLASMGDGKYYLVDLATERKARKLIEAASQPGMDAARSAQLWKQVDTLAYKTREAISEDTFNFLKSYQEGHAKWLDRTKVLGAAQGRKVDWDPEALYVPPIDTKSAPYFAFVRAQDGRVMSTSETAMITAKSPEELQKLANKIAQEHPDLQVIFKADTEDYFKAKGDYEFQAGLNGPTIDPVLRKQGKLGDFVPVLEPRAVVEDFVRHIGRREDQLVRNAVQVNYSDVFANLRWLSDQNTKIQKSKFGYLGVGEAKKLSDPFGDYMRTALDVSKRAEFALWHQANEFVDAVGTRAYGAVEQAWREARAGQKDWEEANQLLERMGMTGVFKSQADYLANQTGADRNLIKLAVAKGNMLLANVTLRLDFANSLINIISSPILMGTEISSIRNSIKKDPDVLKAFNAGLEVAIPGMQGVGFPSATKLMANAVRNFMGNGRKELMERYTNTVGSVRTDLSLFHDMLDDLALTPNLAPKKWAENVNKWTEKGATLTGNNFAEQFTRFVASDVMRQITQPVVEAGKMSVKEQNAFIAIFTNRVQGNYISSQRPIAFQGTLGAGIGLFQTYMFNLFQQLFRHIENRDLKTIAVGGALQSTIFGLNGLPMFDAINTHIIGMANINEGHHDVYSRLAAVDKELADSALYGLASAMPFATGAMPALFTRGDLNPRHITIVPTSFSQVPIVEASGRVAGAVLGVANQVANGADVGSAFMHGLAHNGVSRPLAGLAQVITGESTTGSGSLIAANNDLISVASATRMLGAKPVDEAVALNHTYRLVAYKAADRERLERLGAAVKGKLRDNSLTEDDVTDLMARYAAAGGRIENFSAALQRWTRDANQSMVNKIMQAQRSVYGQRLIEVMGGDELPDYVNQQQTPEE